MANKSFHLLMFLAILLYGCSGPKPLPTVSHGTKEEMKAYAFVPGVYNKFTLADVKIFKVGMWVLYSVSGKTAYDYKVSVVGKEGDAFWVEVTGIEHNGNKLSTRTSARLVKPDSKVVSAFYSEDGGQVVKQEIEPEPEKVQSEWPKTEEKVKLMQSIKCQAGSFTADLHSLTITQEDGSQITEKKFISRDVPPLYEGGLVVLEGADKKIELMAFGDDAKPTITIPQK